VPGELTFRLLAVRDIHARANVADEFIAAANRGTPDQESSDIRRRVAAAG